MTFAQIFTLICLIFGSSVGIDFLASDYDSIQSENLKYVWYIELILEHDFISHVSLCNEVHVSAWDFCVWNNLKVW